MTLTSKGRSFQMCHNSPAHCKTICGLVNLEEAVLKKIEFKACLFI